MDNYCEEVGNGLIIKEIQINGQQPTGLTFPTKKSGRLTVDITQYFQSGSRTTIVIIGEIEGYISDDIVVYSVSIGRMLNSNEMLKELKTRRPIPDHSTKKLGSYVTVTRYPIHSLINL